MTTRPPAEVPPEVLAALAAFRAERGPSRVFAAWRLAYAVARWL